MTDLLRHVETNLRARKLIGPGGGVLAAVSGGVDSMVLLHALHRLAPVLGFQLSVAHFNHRLRGRAGNADQRLVQTTAKALGLPFFAGAGEVAAFAKNSGLSVEMAGRRLRHEFLAATAAAHKIAAVATAHHADDQVELFFLRLFRGSGGEALGGMKWSNPSPANAQIRLIRPLLDVSKNDLRHFAGLHGIRFREDASNSSGDFLRNRIRGELVPTLRQHFDSALDRTVLRVMEVAGAEADFAGLAAADWLRGRGRKTSFDSLHPALQRRIIHGQLIRLGLEPDFERIEELRLRPDRPFMVAPGQTVAREKSGMVRLGKVAAFRFETPEAELRASAKERQISFNGVKIHCHIADNPAARVVPPGGSQERFDAEKVGALIRLRCWRPGDRFQPIGTSSPAKLQDLFVNLKVPRAERHRRVVGATRDGEIFWVEGLRMAERFKLDRGTTRTLVWNWSRLE